MKWARQWKEHRLWSHLNPQFKHLWSDDRRVIWQFWALVTENKDSNVYLVGLVWEVEINVCKSACFSSVCIISVEWKKGNYEIVQDEHFPNHCLFSDNWWVITFFFHMLDNYISIFSSKLCANEIKMYLTHLALGLCSIYSLLQWQLDYHADHYFSSPWLWVRAILM